MSHMKQMRDGPPILVNRTKVSDCTEYLALLFKMRGIKANRTEVTRVAAILLIRRIQPDAPLKADPRIEELTRLILATPTPTVSA